jgi:hypothetical protein
MYIAAPSAERGVEGPVEDLRGGPAPVDRHLLALDGDRARVLQQHVLPQRGVRKEIHPVGAFGQRGDPPPGFGLDVFQRFAQRREERVPPDLVDDRQYPVP